jgi:hypothetical protein
LRRDGVVELAAAKAGAVELLNILVAPLSLALDDASCIDPINPSYVRQGLELDDAPLGCSDDARPGYRVCQEGDAEFRVVAYRAEPAAVEVPGVFGNAEVLTIAN